MQNPPLTLPNQTLSRYMIYGIEPVIIIQGTWLRSYGFGVDIPLKLEVENEKITITIRKNGDTGIKK